MKAIAGREVGEEEEGERSLDAIVAGVSKVESRKGRRRREWTSGV